MLPGFFVFFFEKKGKCLDMAQRGGNFVGEIYKQHSRTMKKKEMSQDMDWQDFVEQLRKIGLELVTDVVWAEIPFYSCGVQAGLPN